MTSLSMMRDGSEVFVPKIPSMKVVDLAATLAPSLPTHVVGIRPGEKIHEVLLPDDDARSTVDLGDRYVICPSSDPEVLQRYLEAGCPLVPEDFSYTSDNNDEWLDASALRELLKTPVV